MKNLAILGPGLLGGSIALATRERGSHRVAMWARRPAAVAEVEKRGIAARASIDLREIVGDAAFVVLCVPIGAMPALARQIAPMLSPETIVTDVGSVKAGVCAQLGGIFRGRVRFVGSHPMAGSDQTGLDFARADLFKGTVSVVTPDESSDPGAVAEVEGFWEALGSRVMPRHRSAHAKSRHLPDAPRRRRWST